MTPTTQPCGLWRSRTRGPYETGVKAQSWSLKCLKACRRRQHGSPPSSICRRAAISRIRAVSSRRWRPSARLAGVALLGYELENGVLGRIQLLGGQAVAGRWPRIAGLCPGSGRRCSSPRTGCGRRTPRASSGPWGLWHFSQSMSLSYSSPFLFLHTRQRPLRQGP